MMPALAQPPHSTPAPSARVLADERRWLIGLLVFAVIVRLATLGAYPLMDNTEARYAEIARKMVETGNWVTPQFLYGVAFWSKPPLSIWMTAVSYLVFGVNEFAARFPSLLACLGIAWLTADLAARRAVPGLGLRAALVLFTTALFFVAAGAVMTDAALTLGTTLSMSAFWQAMTREGRAARAWGYLFFVGLAIGLLAKGPVGVVLTFMPVGLWTLWKGGIGNVWRRLPWISGFLLTTVIALPWYLLAESRTPGFLDYFIIGEHWKRYTVAGWKGDMFGTAHAWPRGLIWPFAVLATLPWCVAWGVLAWRMRRKGLLPRSAGDDSWRAYLWLWLLTLLVFFTFAGNILITYVMPAMPAFALLVAGAWVAVGDESTRGRSTKSSALVIPVLVIAAVLFAGPFMAQQRSHKALVARYMALRASARQQLVYVNQAPESAQFYTAGKEVTVKSTQDLTPYLGAEPRNFFALRPGQLDARPGLHAQLLEVGRYGHYLLFTEPAPTTPAR